mmetsp:Transcript_22805/g.37577  ORF Transcript_22805/g.37577 Transcript_22805/m.37577 type:complete len:90 (+) Transcript_22805:617-886(+)
MMKNITNEIKQKEKTHIIDTQVNHIIIVEKGRGERQVDQTIEVQMATAPTEQNTERNPINIVHEDEEKIMIYTTIITLLLPVEQGEEKM